MTRRGGLDHKKPQSSSPPTSQPLQTRRARPPATSVPSCAIPHRRHGTTTTGELHWSTSYPGTTRSSNRGGGSVASLWPGTARRATTAPRPCQRQVAASKHHHGAARANPAKLGPATPPRRHRQSHTTTTSPRTALTAGPCCRIVDLADGAHHQPGRCTTVPSPATSVTEPLSKGGDMR